MNYIDKINHLRVINNFNLNLPILEDRERNTDLAIAKTMRDFVQNYQSEIRQQFTFILMFDDDLFSLFSYKIVTGAASAIGKTLNIRLCGKTDTMDKELFKNVQTIGIKKAKKLKKAVIITNFNPICNVIDLSEYSKKFIEIFNPLENFTPNDLVILQKYYLDKDKFPKYYLENLGIRNSEEIFWSTYFENLTLDGRDNLKENPIFIEELNKAKEKNIPLVLFLLKGTEEDFPLYDFILKSDKEKNIHLYHIPADKIDFIKTNLNPYINSCNSPQELNIIDDETLIQIQDIDEKENYNFYVYSILNLPEDQDGGE